jgi:hypothetical protein
MAVRPRSRDLSGEQRRALEILAGSDYADGMAAAWRLLAELPDNADAEHIRQVHEATAYMAEWLSRPEEIANYRAMVEILGWDQRRRYSGLIRGLEELRRLRGPESITDHDEVLGIIRRLSYDFELCIPATSECFEGLWRRTPKGMSFADWIRRIGGDPASGCREDAASLDRPCARRQRESRSGRKNARGAGRTKEWAPHGQKVG